jgi:hypothetical protein
MMNGEGSTTNQNTNKQLNRQIADLQKQVAILNDRQAELDKGEK